MSKKLCLYIWFVLVLCLALPVSAEETVIASYEKSEAEAGDLVARINNENANATMVIAWPMLQGTDANSCDPNFGPGLTIPAATDGNCVLGVNWTKEVDGRIDIEHVWFKSTFDLIKNDKIMIDVYIPGPNGVPSAIDMWDETLAWFHGECDIVAGKWFTVTFNLDDLQSSGTCKKNHSKLTTIYFEGVKTPDGKAFFDNLRLWRPDEKKSDSKKKDDDKDK